VLSIKAGDDKKKEKGEEKEEKKKEEAEEEKMEDDAKDKKPAGGFLAGVITKDISSKLNKNEELTKAIDKIAELNKSDGYTKIAESI
jgi:uncharacterized protein with von Willebrand factor type A (vWA) domain